MEKIKKNFGFGCMRLPKKGPFIDHGQFSEMVDAFMNAGFNYFDTAHIYMAFRSEKAIKKCLTSRYPRESYVLVDKLTYPLFINEKGVRPFFEKQLRLCGVDYFDIYLMHAQNNNNFEAFKKHKAYETAFKLKEEGKIRHVGISFHDKAQVLDKILTKYPQIEMVQIQFNYLDYESEGVESRKCYEVCRKHNKPIMVMEPVKGGRLVNLPPEAKAIFDDLKGGSAASYAIRFAASFEGIFMVLSGMGNMDMMNDNISYMKDFKPLTSEEYEAIGKVCNILKNENLIPCTACRYCTDGCPKHIPIPEIFSAANEKKQFKNQNDVGKKDQKLFVKAKDCINCGKCESACPQHIEIRSLLNKISKEG